MVVTFALRSLAGGCCLLLIAAVASACAIDFDRHFAPSSEVCSDGEDNDDNGQLDCEDPACSEQRCVPGPAPGWSGPVERLGAEASCGEASTEVDRGVACSACACDGSVDCPLPTLTFDASACEPPHDTSFSLLADQCLTLDVSGGTLRAQANAVVPVPRCQPTGGGTDAMLLCSLPIGAGCELGGCVPESARVCVHREGVWPCPDAYPNRWMLGAEASACTPCACGAGVDACASETQLFSERGCAGDLTTLPNDGTCATLAAAPRSARHAPPEPQDCAPSGGEPDNDDAVRTVCCL